jgi:hypothetical protein
VESRHQIKSNKMQQFEEFMKLQNWLENTFEPYYVHFAPKDDRMLIQITFLHSKCSSTIDTSVKKTETFSNMQWALEPRLINHMIQIKKIK